MVFFSFFVFFSFLQLLVSRNLNSFPSNVLVIFYDKNYLSYLELTFIYVNSRSYAKICYNKSKTAADEIQV